MVPLCSCVSPQCKLLLLTVEGVQVVTKTKGHISDSGADPKDTLDAPKGTVPLGIGLARTLPTMPKVNTCMV